jgi:isocitrate lyase
MSFDLTVVPYYNWQLVMHKHFIKKRGMYGSFFFLINLSTIHHVAKTIAYTNIAQEVAERRLPMQMGFAHWIKFFIISL